MKTTLLIITLLFGSATVQAEGVRTSIHFSKGQTSTTVSASVVRGDTDRYTLVAKQGQTMTVAITALEKNAVFILYAPKYRIQANDLAGETLPRAGADENATGWTGTLPMSGQYLIEVGGIRGNATYQMTVTIQ